MAGEIKKGVRPPDYAKATKALLRIVRFEPMSGNVMNPDLDLTIGEIVDNPSAEGKVIYERQEDGSWTTTFVDA